MYSCTKWLIEIWQELQKDIFNPKNKLLAEAHAIYSALKAVMTWKTMQGIQECRESCGGLGYSQYAKLGILRQNWDVQQTWEGDNNVLLMQTAKYLTDQLKQKFSGKEINTITCQWVTIDQAEDAEPVIKEKKDYLCIDKLLKCFEHRANLLLQRSALTLSGKLSDMKPVEAWNDTQAFLLNDLSKVYGELVIL